MSGYIESSGDEIILVDEQVTSLLEIDTLTVVTVTDALPADLVESVTNEIVVIEDDSANTIDISDNDIIISTDETLVIVSEGIQGPQGPQGIQGIKGDPGDQADLPIDPVLLFENALI